MRSKLYIAAVLCAGFILPISATFGINTLVDPYGLWGKQIEGFNDYKVARSTRDRLAKAYEARRLAKPDVALGTSRIELGISPVSAEWPEGEAYKLGLFGSSVAEQFAYLRHVNNLSPIRNLVYGVDFVHFNAEKPPKPGFDETILSFNDQRYGWMIERGKVSCSRNTLVDSLETVRASRDRADRRKGVGAQSRPGFARPLPGLWQRSRDEIYDGLEKFPTYCFASEKKSFRFTAENGYSALDEFGQLLRYCRRHEISVFLFIAPAHVAQWESIDSVGLWAHFEWWKRELARLNAHVAEEHATAPYPLWDFSGYNQITSEPFPSPDNPTAPMAYHFDASHYNPTVGDMVLRTLFQGTAEPGFGRLLTSQTIDEVLAAIREERAEWRASHVEDYEEFRARTLQGIPESVFIEPLESDATDELIAASRSDTADRP